MIHYEYLPDEDKDTFNKATEEFQKKCFLSYTKTRDSTIIQKFPLPRVLLHGQTDTVEAEERHFVTEAIDKYVRDALSSRNEAFVDAFDNAMKEAIHGFPVGQGGSIYYNILDPSIQGTNKVGTSHQEAALAGNGDVHALQGSSEQTQGTTTNQIQYNPGPSIQHVQQPMGQSQNQMIKFGTSGHIPLSAQKIAPSIQRIHREIDPYVYNQRL